jgi:hypothetical protein
MIAVCAQHSEKAIGTWRKNRGSRDTTFNAPSQEGTDPSTTVYLPEKKFESLPFYLVAKFGSSHTSLIAMCFVASMSHGIRQRCRRDLDTTTNVWVPQQRKTDIIDVSRVFVSVCAHLVSLLWLLVFEQYINRSVKQAV